MFWLTFYIYLWRRKEGEEPYRILQCLHLFRRKYRARRNQVLPTSRESCELIRAVNNDFIYPI